MSSGHAHVSIIGQCVTWSSLWQEVHVIIFIIFYGISPCLYRYLVHIILNQRPSYISIHSDYKQYCCAVDISDQLACQNGQHCIVQYFNDLHKY